MANRWQSRLGRIEAAAVKRAAAPPVETYEQWAERFRGLFRAAMPEIADWIARHVAPGQRVPLMRLIVTLDDESYEPIEDWINQPFAPWAAMPDGYVFPEMLVNAFIAPAEAVTMAGAPACESCGLRAPRQHVGEFAGDGFGCCPACFCPVTQAANDATGPVAGSRPLEERHRWPRAWRRGT